MRKLPFHGKRTGVSLLAFASVFAGHGASFAQAAQPPETTKVAEVETAEGATDRVVVTGSRIEREGYDAPIPTTVINEESIERTGFGKIADVVNQLPQLMGSEVSTSGNARYALGTIGRSVFNLRGLGIQRSLLLLDGRRIVPASGEGIADNNNIPSQLVQRVDVVTGGASAAYGSDAVSGVINYILNKDYVGLKASLSGGVSDRSDGKEYTANLTYGDAFGGGNGHVLFSAEFAKNEGIEGLNPSDDFSSRKRAWYKEQRLVPNPAFISAAATPNVPQLLTREFVGYRRSADGGLISGNTGAAAAFNNIQFGPGGKPTAFLQGVPADATYMIGGQPGLVVDDVSVQSPLDTYNLFGRVSYDFSDTMSGFVQGMMGYSEQHDSNGGRVLTGAAFSAVPLRVTNAYLDPALAQQMATAGVTNFTVGLNSRDAGYFSARSIRENFMVTAGLNGSFGDDWEWDAYYQYGRTDWKAQARNNPKTLGTARTSPGMPLSSFRAATPLFYFAANATLQGGRVRCSNPSTGADVSAALPGCVPLNIIGTGGITQAALDYSFGTAQFNAEIEQQVAEVSIRGEPISTWAGPVSVVGGVGYRKEDYATPYTDPISQDNGWAAATFKPTNGSYNVKEGFAETVIPLAKDMPFAEVLDFNAAVRYTDYSTSGAVTTWKAGLSYRPISDVLLRGVRSRDVRAPSISDLFAGGNIRNTPISDPRYGNALITSPITTRESGNPNLTPEEADTWSVGAVYQPSWLDNFSFSYDYYEIDLNNGIASVPTISLVQDCTNGRRPDYCAFITRGPGTVSGIGAVPDTIVATMLSPQNLSGFQARGADISASYRFNTSDLVKDWDADVSIRTSLTNVIESSQDDGLGVVHDTAGEITIRGKTPEWRANTEFVYTQGPWTGALTWRLISESVTSTSFNDSASGPFTVDNSKIPEVSYFDLGLTYKLEAAGSNGEIFFRVSNLFDKDPPIVLDPNQYGNTYALPVDPSVYDVVGRFYRAGIRMEF
ncbi:MAG TPA: TonB-dependent receptor [Hyphomonadaceae bacterium]|nr:TonB-dependent receptor [Hyphomonadaceae bacterium]